MSMTFESIDPDGQTKSRMIFKDVTETTTSYTYRYQTRLLSATLLTQSVLTLMEKPPVEEVRCPGLIQGDSAFTRHTLGGYSALAASAKVMPAEYLLSVAYCGLTMPVATERNDEGRSNYPIVAVDPSRTSWTSMTKLP